MSSEKEPKTVEKSVTNTLTEGEPLKNPRRKIRVQFDIEYGGSEGKEMDPKSTTMPDMHMTVRQLLEASARGQDMTEKVRQPLYFETEIPVLNDMVDAEAYKESLNNRLEQVKQFLADEEAREKAEAEEAKKKATNPPTTGQGSPDQNGPKTTDDI